MDELSSLRALYGAAKTWALASRTAHTAIRLGVRPDPAAFAMAQAELFAATRNHAVIIGDEELE